MNAWENAVVTSLGASLLTKLVEGHTLQLTRAETGTGYVTPGTLTSEVAVSEPKQELTFKPITYPEEGKCKLPCRLTNDNVAEGYVAQQVGIYAMDPDVGEILFFIAQASSGDGTIIPSSSEMPGYSAEWTFYFQYGQADGVAVSVDPANSVTREELDKVDAKIGELGQLPTTDKSSIVAAIVEINNDCDGRLVDFQNKSEDHDRRLDEHDEQLAGKADASHNHLYGDITGAPIVENDYDSQSANPQSGIAVAQAIAGIVDSSPEALDTLNELAKALGDDPNFAATMIEELAKKSEKGHTHSVTEVSETDELKYNRILNLTSGGGEYAGTLYAVNTTSITELYEGLEIVVIAETESKAATVTLVINGKSSYVQQKDILTNTLVNPQAGVIGATPTTLRYAVPASTSTIGSWIVVDYPAPHYTYGTNDLTAGTSPLATGKLHFVYE